MPNWKHVAITALISVLAVMAVKRFAPPTVAAYL